MGRPCINSAGHAMGGKSPAPKPKPSVSGFGLERRRKEAY